MTDDDPAPSTESAVDPSASTAASAARGVARELPRGLDPGDCLGRYTVRSLIGAGGMGQVFAATDNELGRTVALKVIRPDRGASSYARARLQREAQALALLRHPNVVTVHDVGTEGDIVFLAMELVEGPTLGDWLRAEPRSWRAIRDVFLAAGRGLAAAHAAGIVHRDFKPHNVIVGADRVVVVDFGLARAGDASDDRDESSDPAPPSQDSLHLPLTLTGERLGTPRYMSPEQRAGEVVTAKADQFAFCVALQEAVLGRAGDEAARPVDRVPRFVTAAIARGLAALPEDRWPSMDALLAVLGRVFWTPRRRRVAGATAAVLVAAVAALGFTAGRRAAASPPCSGGAALVAPLWDDATRASVHDAFRATGRLFADDAFARVDRGLRERLDGWASSHRDNCEATHVRHEQSEAMLDLRAHCLDRARTELSTLIGLLREADGRVVERAASAVTSVGDITRCADPVALGAAIAPPPPAQAAEVEAMRQDLARVSPLWELGKWKEVESLVRSLVAHARRVGYKPLIARAVARWGRYESDTQQYDAALTDLYEVAQLGTEVGDDDIVAAALPWLSYTLGMGKNRFDAADMVYRWATAAVARAGNAPIRLTGLYGNRAVVLGRQGDHEGALELYHKLIDLETQRVGPESIGVGWTLHSIGQELSLMGRMAEAVPYYQRAVALIEKAYGTEHPLVATVLYGSAWPMVNSFEYEAAATLFERANAIYERTLGPDDLRLSSSLYGLAVARLGQGRIPEARAAIERSLAIQQARGPDDGRELATRYDALGDVEHREGHPDIGHDLARKALALKLKTLDPAHEVLAETYRLDARHLLALGRLAEARDAADRGLAIDEKARGKDHPEVGWSLIAQGDVMAAQHQVREALAAYERALQVLEKAYGAGHAGLCAPLSRLSAAALTAGDARRARELAERAVAQGAKAAPGDLDVAQVRLAQARWALGKDRPGALVEARQARARLAALGFSVDELPGIDRWLATVR